MGWVWGYNVHVDIIANVDHFRPLNYLYVLLGNFHQSAQIKYSLWTVSYHREIVKKGFILGFSVCRE